MTLHEDYCSDKCIVSARAAIAATSEGVPARDVNGLLNMRPGDTWRGIPAVADATLLSDENGLSSVVLYLKPCKDIMSLMMRCAPSIQGAEDAGDFHRGRMLVRPASYDRATLVYLIGCRSTLPLRRAYWLIDSFERGCYAPVAHGADARAPTNVSCARRYDGAPVLLPPSVEGTKMPTKNAETLTDVGAQEYLTVIQLRGLTGDQIVMLTATGRLSHTETGPSEASVFYEGCPVTELRENGSNDYTLTYVEKAVSFKGEDVTHSRMRMSPCEAAETQKRIHKLSREAAERRHRSQLMDKYGRLPRRVSVPITTKGDDNE